MISKFIHTTGISLSSAKRKKEKMQDGWISKYIQNTGVSLPSAKIKEKKCKKNRWMN